MSVERPHRSLLPESARQTLDDFVRHLGVQVHLWGMDGDTRERRLYPDATVEVCAPPGDPFRSRLHPRHGAPLELEVWADNGGNPAPQGALVADTLQRTLDSAQEIRFFTFELSERYEEINLLYSISETLGSTLGLDRGARLILREVCDVMGARRGSIWVHQAADSLLKLVASVGEQGRRGPLRTDDPEAVTARVFREGRPLMAGSDALRDAVPGVEFSETETFLSVPIRYTPPEGDARTVGVINLIGRSHGERFTASDQKLLSAIASQVGAALENHRLIQQSLARERMAREMELAHNLQMKLLPAVDRVQGARVAARVEPAEMVGGDFYQVFQLTRDRVGLMIGDVSSHGFPAALIMALSMSAATIYAAEFSTPAKVLRHVSDALRDELESTEMYLTLFYGVIDPRAGTLTWSNAGHPHAFLLPSGSPPLRLGATDPPVGIAGPGAYGQEETRWDPDGDLVTLFTDGLSDALAGSGPVDGERRVVDRIDQLRDRPPGEIVEALFAEVRSVRSTVPPDDRTALVLAGE
jgi:sigma-B regulation protein RsbU (phosphoserine phosphatase)